MDPLHTAHFLMLGLWDGVVLAEFVVAKKQFLGKMKSAEDNVRGKVSGRSLWLYDWSKPLWDADYRDEGTGDLNVTRPPDINAKIGMQWLKETAGGVKRRWILQGKKKKKVVNKAWYGAQGYPKPGGLK